MFPKRNIHSGTVVPIETAATVTLASMNAPNTPTGNQPEKDYYLTIIVNGVATKVETNPNAALAGVIAKALQQTNNTGQPPDNWILTTESGTQLSPTAKPGELGLHSGAKLFLNLKAGAGGNV